jgi:CMP-N-acetylneuraminic acid synthetase
VNTDELIIAVIPARSGSVRIKEKNLQKINDMTLFEWACESVPQYVNHTVVSTDCNTCAHLAADYGFEVLWRPPSLSGHEVSGIAVWQHAMTVSEACQHLHFSCSILLQPSTPTRTQANISDCVDAVTRGGWNAACTISKVPDRWAPHKQVEIRGGKLGMVEQRKIASHSRDGACFAADQLGLWDFYANCAGIESRTPQINIDEPFDLDLARNLLATSR